MHRRQRATKKKFLTLQSCNTSRNDALWKLLLPLQPLLRLHGYQLHQMKKKNKQAMVTQVSLINIVMNGVAMATIPKKVMKVKCNQIKILVNNWLMFYIIFYNTFLSLLWLSALLHQNFYLTWHVFLYLLSLKKKSLFVFPISYLWFDYVDKDFESWAFRYYWLVFVFEVDKFEHIPTCPHSNERKL